MEQETLREGNKWDKSYLCPSPLQGENFQTTAQEGGMEVELNGLHLLMR